MVRVSVILPVYNGALYLQECLDSIWAQSLQNFECIVVDDGSTDETSEILARQCDSRLLVVRSVRQGGICKALNLGISHAKGQFIARMDADDICHPSRFEKQVEYLQSHPQIGFCGSWVRRFGENQIPLLYARPIGPKRIRAYAVFDNPMVHSSIMFQGDLVRTNKNLYLEDFAGAEDYELWTRLLESTECENLSDILLDYRLHSQSITLTKTQTMDILACRILKKELSKLGIIPSDYDVLQHRLWSTGRLDKNCGASQIDRAEAWLKRLINANQDVQAHDNHAFLWAVREIWYALCYQLQAWGFPVLHRFFKSSISRGDMRHGYILIGSWVKQRLL